MSFCFFFFVLAILVSQFKSFSSFLLTALEKTWLTVTSYLIISFQNEEAENFFFIMVVVPVKNAPAVAS